MGISNSLQQDLYISSAVLLANCYFTVWCICPFLNEDGLLNEAQGEVKQVYVLAWTRNREWAIFMFSLLQNVHKSNFFCTTDMMSEYKKKIKAAWLDGQAGLWVGGGVGSRSIVFFCSREIHSPASLSCFHNAFAILDVMAMKEGGKNRP